MLTEKANGKALAAALSLALVEAENKKGSWPIALRAKGGQLAVVAAEEKGRSLVLFGVPWRFEEFSVQVTKAAAKKLLTAIRTSQFMGILGVGLRERGLSFDIEYKRAIKPLWIETTDKMFPDYERITPPDKPEGVTRVSMWKESIAGALRAVDLRAVAGKAGLRIEKPGVVYLYGTDQEDPWDLRVDASLRGTVLDGEDFRTHVDPMLIYPKLEAMPGRRVTMSYVKDIYPMVFEVEDPEPNLGAVRVRLIVMPIVAP